MKKKQLLGAVLSLCLTMGMSMGVSADSRKVVTLGADLTDQQKQIVMNYFGVKENDVDILTINNQDEREHLSAYVPLEQIGTHTYSCALVSPTSSGGIQVKTANLDWVTCNMIATTLSTSGVVNCDVVAASPIKVSGTGALTGIIMAYEEASGETLDPQKKELATQELVVTGELANNLGQKEATAIVNQAKTEIISQNITDITIIQNIVNEAAQNNEAQLSQEDLDLITDLLDKIAQEDYDYDEMKDTLERVGDNVGATEELSSQNSAEEEKAAQEAAQNASQEAQNAETEESILNNTNDGALGDDVVSGSTLEPETDAPQTEAPSGLETEMPAETEIWNVPAETEGLIETPVETEGLVPEPLETEGNTEAPLETEGFSEAPLETEAYPEAPAETELLTEVPQEMTETPGYTEEDLTTEEQKEIYKKANWYLKKVLGLETVSDDPAYAEVEAMEVKSLLVSQETAQKILDSFDDFLLELLVEGPESMDLSDTDLQEYGKPEVKAVCDFLKKLLVEDEAQQLLDVSEEDRQTVLTEAKSYFKKLYKVEGAEETEAQTELQEGTGEDLGWEENQESFTEAPLE